MPISSSPIRGFGLVGAAIAALVVAAVSAEQPAAGYDLVIANGRVMDPESGLDAVRHVGIRGGTIAAISETPLTGARVIDAARHVVAPGFVDLHEHGQQDESYRMMVRDGVTSAFELEVGTANVAAWYAAREGGQIVNYGVSIGHIPARMKVLEDPGKGLLPAGVGGSGTANDAQMAAMELLLREGLAQGAVAMGFGSAYTPGAPMSEIERMFRVAAEGGVSAHIHMRGGLAGLRETIKAAAAAGAPAAHRARQLVGRRIEIDGFLAAIQGGARRRAGRHDRGLPVRGRDDGDPVGAVRRLGNVDRRDASSQHQLVSTGERLTRKTFAEARKTGGTVITHGRSEQQTRAAIVSPLAMIASDGFIENGRGHPRTSGTYAKVLGRYVRDEGAVTLMNALATHDPRTGAAPRASHAGDGDEGPRQGRRRRGPHRSSIRRPSSTAPPTKTPAFHPQGSRTWWLAARWSSIAAS